MLSVTHNGGEDWLAIHTGTAAVVLLLYHALSHTLGVWVRSGWPHTLSSPCGWKTMEAQRKTLGSALFS